MKTVALAVVFCAITAPAFAGGTAEPVMERVVVVDDNIASAGGILVPVLALVLFAAALVSD